MRPSRNAGASLTTFTTASFNHISVCSLGFRALDQKLESGNSSIRDNVQELLELTNHELAALRRFVGGLRASEERMDVLLPAIERYAERFSLVTGIKVDVAAEGKIKVNDRLAAELFQIVAEGLSNVRRHAFLSRRAG
jgi:signal transduction histidine kinase